MDSEFKACVEVEVNEVLYEAVSCLLKDQPELGYLDEADFIRDSLRQFLVEA